MILLKFVHMNLQFSHIILINLPNIFIIKDLRKSYVLFHCLIFLKKCAKVIHFPYSSLFIGTRGYQISNAHSSIKSTWTNILLDNLCFFWIWGRINNHITEKKSSKANNHLSKFMNMIRRFMVKQRKFLSFKPQILNLVIY